MKDNKVSPIEDASPFHYSEQLIQDRIGKKETMANIGRRAIRPYMPDQHREFYQQLPFMVVGSVDSDGWPWASILSGKPGFIQSPTPTTLEINALAANGDPIIPQLQNTGSPLGLLGIEPHSRRRNRVNGRISNTKKTNADTCHFSVEVDQSFGNCPQYIQSRHLEFVRDPSTAIPLTDTRNITNTSFTNLSDTEKTIIQSADTFFVSSYVNSGDRPKIEGVDVSHRGGRPGFIKVEGNTLTIPDYSGNYFFNTLGNFLANPKAGLVFVDFSSGDLLMLTGTVTLLWEDEPEVIAYKGAERAWRFTLDHGITLYNALPFRASFGEYSPNTLMAGNWSQADATLQADIQSESWLHYTVNRIQNESTSIRSFYLVPQTGQRLPSFKAGQFLTLRLSPKRVASESSQKPIIRTYTISSAPGENYYRISVKREEDGYISQYLHDNITLGDIIEIKPPRGDFTINSDKKRPVVLIAGGVGITPMISMASHIVNEGLHTRTTRSLTIFHAAKTSKERAFSSAFKTLEKQSNHAVRYYSFLSKAEHHEKPDIDFHGLGRINSDTFQQILPLDGHDYDRDFYLCGPDTFMQAMYEALKSLGVQDH